MTNFDFKKANQLAEIHGDAYYLYDQEIFSGNFRRFRDAFRSHYPNTEIAYSYKTNYTPAICQQVDRMNGLAEVVSEMEYSLARRIGVAPERIIYNGPCKSADSMQEALTAGSIVNLDSIRDLKLLLAIADANPGISMRVGIRCNFPAPGCPDSRFGIDVEGPAFAETINAIQTQQNTRLAGLHCHFPNREIESFAERTSRLLELADQIFEESPEFLNIGGGYFGNLPKTLRKKYSYPIPTYEDYANIAARLVNAKYGTSKKKPTLFVEPGTALVANTFKFITRVIETKRIRGRNLAFVSGSIFNTSPYARATGLPATILRPTAEGMSGDGAKETWDIVGYTCIEGDVLTSALAGPIEPGDFIVYENVGSYSIVMKPPFILPNVPILRSSGTNGEIDLIRKAETNEYPFQNFEF